MFIATRKKKENIAEYLLYMWQIEDLIRANNLNMEAIQANIIDRYDCLAEDKKRLTDWYESLIDMMVMENKQKYGHIQLIQNVIIDLTDLHLRLLKSPKDASYAAEYYKTLPFIVELRSKDNHPDMPEVETCFTALYGFLLLKLQQRTVGEETMAAIKRITSFISLLACYYNKDRNGDLELD
ncbi:MAG TPA: DUF4924 family protein [Bacteroidales bacterium]